MLKNWKICAFAVAFAGLLAFPATGWAADSDVKFTRLPFMGGYLTEHPVTREVFQPFMEAAEKTFGGRLSFEYFSTNALYSETAANAVFTVSFQYA